MKAIVLNQYGDTSNFSKSDVKTPEIKPNEILVEVHTFSFNPYDGSVRKGMFGKDENRLPLIQGCDVAGDVVKVGSDVNDFKVGDRVAADLGSYGSGYAEYAADPADVFAKIPDNVSYDQADAIGLAGETAYQALIDELNIQPNEKVLLLGASGGVGHLAVQIAKDKGAFVAVTASPNHAEMLKELGADVVIDYHKQAPKDVISDYDAVFDMVNRIDDGLAVLKPNGRLATVIGSPTDEQKAKFKIYQTITNPSGKNMAELLKLASEGKLKAVINRTVPFTSEGVKNAQDQIDTHHTNGKIICKIKP
ncbi:NADP-dependent oxidoreductase [Lactobacillaceae bacterium Melli_B3]